MGVVSSSMFNSGSKWGQGGGGGFGEEPGLKINFYWPCKPPPVDLAATGWHNFTMYL